MKTIHPKILQLRRNVAGIYVSSNYEEPLDYRIKSDGLTTEGYLAVFGVKDLDNTICVKGCFANSINQRGPQSKANDKIAFLYFHDITQPIGQFTELEEDNYGLRFVAKHNREVQSQREKGIEINDGTLNQFSFGFYYIWDKIEWDDRLDGALMYECDLREGSALTIMASNTATFAVRSEEDKIKELLDLGEKMEAALLKLPKAQQLEIRQYVTKYKTLASEEPGPTKATLETRSKPDLPMVAMGGYKLNPKEFLIN
jgi:uncharacterized protein